MDLEKLLKSLTKKELLHFIASVDNNEKIMEKFKSNRAAQRKHDKENPHGMMACWECRHIAKKLGLEE